MREGIDASLFGAGERKMRGEKRVAELTEKHNSLSPSCPGHQSPEWQLSYSHTHTHETTHTGLHSPTWLIP